MIIITRGTQATTTAATATRAHLVRRETLVPITNVHNHHHHHHHRYHHHHHQHHHHGDGERRRRSTTALGVSPVVTAMLSRYGRNSASHGTIIDDHSGSGNSIGTAVGIVGPRWTATSGCLSAIVASALPRYHHRCQRRGGIVVVTSDRTLLRADGHEEDRTARVATPGRRGETGRRLLDRRDGSRRSA